MTFLRCATSCLLIVLLTACQPETQNLLPTPLPTKAFLPSVDPEPGERISYEDYQAKLEGEEFQAREFGPVCVTYVAEEVLEYGDDGFRMEDFLSRSVLIVDNEVWPNSSEPDTYRDYLNEKLFEVHPITGEYQQIAGNAIGPFVFCWDVELEPGIHSVEFKTRKTSGEELSYSWSFVITK